MTKNSSYQHILNLASCLECSQTRLNALKAHFASEINSNRCLDSIANLKQLLAILEKRGALSSQNLEAIEIIGITLKNKPLLDAVDNYKSLTSCQNSNQSIQCSPAENVNHTPPSVFPDLPKDSKQKAYKLIAEEIGQKWSDFARALGIKEAHIDDLNAVPRIADRVFQILDYCEKNTDSRIWKSKLSDALQESRRNDLRKRVQNILDTQ